MNDKEQFAQLLGLIPPWKIADVHVDYYVPQIHIEISYPNGEKAYFLVIHFRLKPTIAVAHMLTCLKHRITNAVSKGINSKIQQIESVARDFRNFNNYRAAILFYCGRLDMYP